ncbi:MAG: PDZ domain-containing protein [Planctomycetia bacterium]|nr:PDZ domain-containing protein [Planctomycetia bacterium]
MIGITRRYRTICALALCHLALGSGWLAAQDNLQIREERAMKAALSRVAPSVVRIETVGGLERVERILIGTGPTTGLVVSPDGYIISSAFNFVQKPDSILITLEDGSRHAAKLVATDQSRMLVLLKLETEGKLAMPEFVPQSEMRVGWWALAVGRTFEPRDPNLSVGIISALDRIWGKAIQTDAKISPNNYGGPLVDIAGRVLGVLVPMSPDAHGEVAGVEWYDSGIGFAIPLESIFRVLPKLEQGQDLRPGLLGINMKSADLYAQPAVIAAARATGPAYKAGFRGGDKIVEAAGVPITRQAELKQQLGRLYAGDKIKLVALRGDQRVDRELELVDKIEPYEFPFLGILPMRNAKGDNTPGLVVRYVYPDSPAAAVGIKPADRIQSFAGEAVRSAETMLEKLQTLEADEKVKIEVRRGGEMVLVEPQLGKLPESLPGELPPAHGSLAPAEGERPQVGLVALKIPEFENQCLAYVPESYHPQLAYGVVVWLHAPGGFKQEELIERWKPLCEQYDFILLAPKSLDPKSWQPIEARFVRRVLDDVMKNYTTDAARIVVHGHEGGGALAYLVGMANVDVVRAVAAVEAPLPRQVQPPETDPVHRLAFYTTLSSKGETAAGIEVGIKRLRELKYPLTVKNIGDVDRYLTPQELAELVRWFDSLDRL